MVAYPKRCGVLFSDPVALTGPTSLEVEKLELARGAALTHAPGGCNCFCSLESSIPRHAAAEYAAFRYYSLNASGAAW